MAVSNRVRGLVWALMIVLGYLAGLALNGALGLRCPALPCIALGAVLLVVILRAAAVTGRYLAVYGKTRGGGFGDLDRLVTEGPYSCMRHPMHLFLSLFPVAVGLLTANPGMALIVGPLEAAAVLVMAVTVDEAESLERFGEAYEEYRRRVPAFNPSPRCLWKALARRPPRGARAARRA